MDLLVELLTALKFLTWTAGITLREEIWLLFVVVYAHAEIL